MLWKGNNMLKASEIKQKNERVKRAYFRYMLGPGGFSDQSINVIEKAMWQYEEFTNQADYATYSSRVAEDFKKYLKEHVNKKSKQPLGLKSQYHCLRHIKKFFVWLAGQPGYKSRISFSDVEYLRLNKKESRMATAAALPEYPTLEQVQKLCSFPVEDEIDRRDRALIAFTAITGMRDRAVVTLPIGCYDPINNLVSQLPEKGVQTKFSKEIYTTICKVDDTLVKYFRDWYTYLIQEKRFSLTDPLFPCTELGTDGPNSLSFVAKGISHKFWANAGVMRKIFRERSEEVGIPYFSPHKFRHFLIVETQKHISNMEQFKALSQNVGHENMGTTFYGYGAIDRHRVNHLVNSIDYSSKSGIQDEDEVRRVTQMVMEQLRKNSL